MAHLDQAEAGRYVMSSTSGELRAHWLCLALPKAARLHLQKHASSLNQVGDWLCASHLHEAEKEKEKEKEKEEEKSDSNSSDNSIFQLKGEADTYAFWGQPSPMAVSMAWCDVVKEVLFGQGMKKEGGMGKVIAKRKVTARKTRSTRPMRPPSNV